MNTKRALIAVCVLVMTGAGFVGGVLGLSSAMVEFEAGSAPAFVLWRMHLFPYMDRYVKAGLLDTGEIPVKNELRGKPIETVSARFGAKATLVDKRWDERWKMWVERYELSRPSHILFVMREGKCIEMQFPGQG